VALATVWGFLYIYTFDLTNQLVGVEEDRLNKPSRPLVTGLVSPRGARVRSLVSNLLYLCLSWPLGVAHFALWWQAIIFGYHYLGGHKHPLGKATWMPLGVFPMLAAPWQIGAGSPPTGAVWTWFAQLAFMGGLMMLQQDLRDLEGDAKIGRRTLPMVMGEGKFRALSAAVYVVAPFFFQATMLSGKSGVTSVALAATLFNGLWYMAYRTSMLRSREADRLTYRLFCYWFCYMMVFPLVMWPDGF
jgi:4-hydroxybenzoate polyprenyltransferase